MAEEEQGAGEDCAAQTSATATAASEPFEEPPMEIHKPKPVHSWRELLTEIGVIVIGVAIALAAEQTVEYFHHLSQLQTTRQELTIEKKENEELFAFNRAALNAQKAELSQDMAILIASRDNHTALKGALHYKWDFRHVAEGSWQVARQNGSLELMPHAELADYTRRYDLIEGMAPLGYRVIEQMTRALAIAGRSPNGNFSPRDLDELVTVTSDAQGAAENLSELMDASAHILQPKQK